MILPLFLYNFTPIRNGIDTYFCAVEMRLHKCQKTQKTDMIMKHNFSLLCAATCALSFFSMNDAQALKVHTIGDSTMANYEEGTTDKRGWGQMFNQFFMGDIEVNNRAKSGASSKSFYNEAPYWTTVKQQIEAGDYVFIQFAHNDEKNDGVDGDELQAQYPDSVVADTRGTSPFGTYKEYLRKYVDETRALDATPVLVTPIVRKYFGSDGKITQKGRHNLSTDGSHDLDYVLAMKEVADEKGVLLIDHTEMTAQLVEAYGVEEATAQLYCADDNTHTSATGAMLFARLVAQDMVRQGILAEYVNAEASIIVNPSAIDFGRGYPSAVKTYECTVMGMDLVPAEGNITISATEPFTVSADGVAFQSSIDIPYTDGALALTRFVVKGVGSEAGILEGVLTVTNGNVENSVPMTLEVVDLTDGEPFSVFWDLSKTSDYVAEGPVTPVAESWSKMYAKSYASPGSDVVWPEESGIEAGYKTQRNCIEGDVWPAGELDAVSDRYIQFGVRANPGSEMTVDTIGIYIGGSGGSGMIWRVEYSIEENFANQMVISENLKNAKNTMYAIEAVPMVKVPAGKTLLLRIYPWYNGEATGKTICLSNLYIGGVVSATGAVETPRRENNLRYEGTTLRGEAGVALTVYNLAGACVAYGTGDLDLHALPQGVYVARSGENTLKVVR